MLMGIITRIISNKDYKNNLIILKLLNELDKICNLSLYNEISENYNNLTDRDLQKVINKLSKENCKINIDYRAIKNFIRENFDKKIIEKIKDLNLDFEKIIDDRYYLGKRFINFKKIENKTGEFIKTIFKKNNKAYSIYNPFEKASDMISSVYGKKDKIFAEVIEEERYIEILLTFLLKGIKDFHLFPSNALLSPAFKKTKTKLRKFDIILSNLVMLDTRYFYEDEKIRKDPFKKFVETKYHKKRPIPLYLTHIIKTLSDNGIAAVIVQNNFLYRGGADIEIKNYLIKNNLIDSILLFPNNWVFNTFTKFSLIIIKKDKKTKDFLLIDLNKTDINKAAQIYEERKEENQISVLLSETDFKNEKFDLRVENYMINSIKSFDKFDLKETVLQIQEYNKKIKENTKKLDKLNDEIEKLLS